MDDLKYRKRLSTSVDKGIYRAVYNYSIDTRIPLSRLLDEALEDFLHKNNVEYMVEAPYERKNQ